MQAHAVAPPQSPLWLTGNEKAHKAAVPVVKHGPFSGRNSELVGSQILSQCFTNGNLYFRTARETTQAVLGWACYSCAFGAGVTSTETERSSLRALLADVPSQ